MDHLGQQQISSNLTTKSILYYEINRIIASIFVLTLGRVLSPLRELTHFNLHTPKVGHCFDFSLQVRKLKCRAVFGL